MESKIIEIAKKNNGYIYSKLIKENNISTIYMTRLVRKGMLDRVYRGVYILKEYEADYLFIFTLVYKNFIYCRNTALYLNELSNKQLEGYHILIPHGLKEPVIENAYYYHTRKQLLDIETDYVKTPFGNKVKCFSKERCICDLFINDSYDYEDRVYAINKYRDESLDYKKLYECAKALGVYEEVSNVFEVIGWN